MPSGWALFPFPKTLSTVLPLLFADLTSPIRSRNQDCPRISQDRNSAYRLRTYRRSLPNRIRSSNDSYLYCIPRSIRTCFLLSACPIQEPLSGSTLRHLYVSGDSARNPTCVKVNFIYFPLTFPVITIRCDMNNRVSMPIAFYYIGFHFIAPFHCTLCGLSVVRFLCEQFIYGAA